MASVVIARVDVGVPVVVIAESVCGSQQMFRDEALLEKSLFFCTMCNRCGSANFTAGGTGYPCTESRLSVHTNMDMRSLAQMCTTLPGFKWEQITRNFFLSQHTSIEQFLPLTRKELFTIHFVRAAATTIAKRRCP